MNFLAHIYLSNNDKDITIGNFIADNLKGKQYLEFPERIQQGVLLHRKIDSFTDTHPIVKLSKVRLYNNYSHYAGVIVDILYDHFLAKNWTYYSTIPLEVFANNFYNLLNDNFEILPLSIQNMIPFMIRDNWLVSYASIDGISKVLEGMNKRTKNKSKMNLAVNDLQEFYTDFESEFTSFFKELITYTNQTLNDL